MAVNVLGCFLFGLIWTLTENRFLVGPPWRTILLMGFVVEIVDTPERVAAFLPELDQMMHSGLVTLERVRALAYRRKPPAPRA